jgi:hypothetical protein
LLQNILKNNHHKSQLLLAQDRRASKSRRAVADSNRSPAHPMGDVPDFVDEDDADVWEGGGTAYKIEKVVGNGAFGIVWKARAVDTGEVVAIKKVLLDRRYQNRELQMMKVMDHDCVVRLKHYYEKPVRARAPPGLAAPAPRACARKFVRSSPSAAVAGHGQPRLCWACSRLACAW